jgi:hypothetical protein
MTAVDLAGFAKPHQSTVVEILRAVRQELFTAAEAEVLINRIRSLATDAAATEHADRPERA